MIKLYEDRFGLTLTGESCLNLQTPVLCRYSFCHQLLAVVVIEEQKETECNHRWGRQCA